MILYTLDIKRIKKEIKKFLIMSAFVLVFGIIYEIFSHQVYSLFMICAFLIPLILGALIYYILYSKERFQITNASNNLYKSFIYTLTVASIIKGVLDIYGTTNSLIIIYPFVSSVLLLLAIAFNLKK